MAEVMEQGYKGYAYVKGNNKPYVIYGNSNVEILSRLQGFNRARSQQMQYSTVNIGKLDAALNKYTNYQKFEVASGKNITPIYLHLPSLPKEEFKMLTNQLKESGAKFNGIKKEWYVTPDLKEKFSKYIEPQKENPHEEIMKVKEILSESEAQADGMIQQYLDWKPKHDMIGFEDTITVHISENKKVAIDTKTLPEEYWTANAFEKLKILDDVLDNVLPDPVIPAELQEQKEHVRVIDTAEYVLSIPKEIENNECTVYFKDGRDPLQLFGDQFGVSLPGIPDEEATVIIENYLLSQSEYQSVERLDIATGNELSGFLFKEVAGEAAFYPFHATVDDSNGIEAMLHYFDRPYDESYEIVKTNKIFSNQQMEAAQQVLKIGRSADEIKLICNAEYTPAQIEEMVSGIKDGLRETDIKLYANPKIPSWKMDMYRIGLQHGIRPENISTICNQAEDWMSARTSMTEAIKEHRLDLSNQIAKSGFKPSPETVRKLEQLNHLTGRENSMKDICKAFKERTYADQPKVDALVRDIGREFQLQEAAMQAIR